MDKDVNAQEEIREEGSKALRCLVPIWLFNALMVIGTWFALAWTQHNQHWSEMAWGGLLFTWCITKTVVSFFMIIAFLKYISGKRPE